MTNNSQKEPVEIEAKEEPSLDDFFDKQEAPKVRIHSSPGESVCTSCEG